MQLPEDLSTTELQSLLLPVMAYARTNHPVIFVAMDYLTAYQMVAIPSGSQGSSEVPTDESQLLLPEDAAQSLPDPIPDELTETPVTDAISDNESVSTDFESILPGNWKATLTIGSQDRERFPFPIFRLLVPFEVNWEEKSGWFALITASNQISPIDMQLPQVSLSLQQTITTDQIITVSINLDGEIDQMTHSITGTFLLWIEGESEPYAGTWSAQKE